MDIKLLEAERKMLINMLTLAKKDLTNSPPGKLRTKINKTTPVYYYRESPSDKYGTYIKSKDRKLAIALAQKGYAEDMIKIIEKRISILDNLLESYTKQKLTTIYEEYAPARRKLITPYVISDEEYIRHWLVSGISGTSAAAGVSATTGTATAAGVSATTGTSAATARSATTGRSTTAGIPGTSATTATSATTGTSSGRVRQKTDQLSNRQHSSSSLNMITAPYQAFSNDSCANNPQSKDNRIFTTAHGEKVRSKSEVIIADTLLRMGIPYIYEKPYYYDGNKSFNPDFTVLNVKRRKEIYIEHFGKMGSAGYRADFFWKMKTFGQIGIVQGENLVMTFEDEDHPFDIAYYINDIKRMCFE